MVALAFSLDCELTLACAREDCYWSSGALRRKAVMTERWGEDRREADAQQVIALIQLRSAVEAVRDAVIGSIVVFILYQEGLRYWAWGVVALVFIVSTMRAVSPSEDSYLLARLKRVLLQS